MLHWGRADAECARKRGVLGSHAVGLVLVSCKIWGSPQLGQVLAWIYGRPSDGRLALVLQVSRLSGERWVVSRKQAGCEGQQRLGCV